MVTDSLWRRKRRVHVSTRSLTASKRYTSFSQSLAFALLHVGLAHDDLVREPGARLRVGGANDAVEHAGLRRIPSDALTAHAHRDRLFDLEHGASFGSSRPGPLAWETERIFEKS